MNLDQVLFLAIALFGALFLLASFVLGELGEAFDSLGDSIGDQLPFGGDAMDAADIDGPSPLSLRNLMAFLTAYGASGMITSSLGWSTVASSLFAILPGVVMAAIAYKFMQALYGQQSSSVVELSGLVGRAGVIDLGIPASGLGRVTVYTGTGQSTFLARSEGGIAIPAGEKVLIKGNLGTDLLVSRAPEV